MERQRARIREALNCSHMYVRIRANCQILYRRALRTCTLFVLGRVAAKDEAVQIDGRTNGWTDGRTNEWTGGRTDEQMDGRTNGRTDGRTNERTNGRIDGGTECACVGGATSYTCLRRKPRLENEWQLAKDKPLKG